MRELSWSEKTTNEFRWTEQDMTPVLLIWVERAVPAIDGVAGFAIFTIETSLNPQTYARLPFKAKDCAGEGVGTEPR